MKIFCSGIGGIGLSAYASLQKAAGHEVLGSDRTETALIQDLRSQGITVTLDQTGDLLPTDLDLFVSSEAIPKDAPERQRAAELGIPQQSYPQAVGEMTQGTFLITVAGSHGKSSTTAMAANVLIDAGKDPTVIVGTKLKELGGRNWRRGGSDLFLLEACEYRHSFHFYNPSIVLLTTCDGDHFDFYPSQEAYDEAFRAFLERLPEDGSVVTHRADPDCARVTRGLRRSIIDADRYPLVPLETPGRHMQENAQLVLALADVLEIPQGKAKKSLSAYEGAWRRTELKGEWKKAVPVIDDYGHHPREIRATLSAIRSRYPKKRMVLVFQPHTHDRTIHLYDDFVGAFVDADCVIIPNVYEARTEIETERIDVDQFVSDIARASAVEAVNGKSLERTEMMLKESLLRDGDLLVCMGAGDITDLATVMVRSPA